MCNQVDINIDKVNTVHCVGIGGIGVSAIARFFAHRGAVVSGSDASTSPILEGLRDEGITTSVGHEVGNVPEGTDLVIHSIAVPHDNPELARARKLGIPTITYPQALGLISAQRKTIAVSGTHGKTTTTAMLADIFTASRFNPTVIVGSLLKEAQSNFVPGNDDLFVVEACEYKRSFLHLEPDVLVITNVDTDHLDYFDGLADVQDAFCELADKVPADGAVVCNPNQPKLQPALPDNSALIQDFSETRLSGDLQVFGEHNKENARAAVAAAQELGVAPDTAKTAVRSFSGTWRRAQKKGETEDGVLVYDDYGHHPTEISSTLAGFRQQFSDRQLVVIFQPHLYSRTAELLDEFADSLQIADAVIVLPIYAARETPDTDISAHDLVAEMRSQHDNVYYADNPHAAQEKAIALAENNASLILTQGAGDVYEVADHLVSSASEANKAGS